MQFCSFSLPGSYNSYWHRRLYWAIRRRDRLQNSGHTSARRTGTATKKSHRSCLVLLMPFVEHKLSRFRSSRMTTPYE